MGRKLIAALMIGCSVAGVAACVGSTAHARGPGNSRSLGASSGSGPSGGGAANFAPANPRSAWSGSDYARSARATLPHTNELPTAPLDSRGISQQQINEARIYEHRLGQAERLRTIAERNGNSHLPVTADRMESQANEHFNQRMERIALIAPPQSQIPTEPVASTNPPQPVAGATPAEQPASHESRRRWRWWPFHK